MDVTVLVATYGAPVWSRLADRACASVPRDVPLVRVHKPDGTLHEVRNEALAAATTEFVIHLDADDQLEAGYIDAMRAGSGDVRAPLVRYVPPGAPRPRRLPPAGMPQVAGHDHDCTARCLVDGNWIIVGACARRELLLEVGGWRDFAWSEDWDLWLRCHRSGAAITWCPEAVYRATVRPRSRNRAAPRRVRLDEHERIARANGLR